MGSQVSVFHLRKVVKYLFGTSHESFCARLEKKELERGHSDIEVEIESEDEKRRME